MNKSQIIAGLVIVALVVTVMVVNSKRAERLATATETAFQELSLGGEAAEAAFARMADVVATNRAVFSFTRSEAASQQQCDALKQQMLTAAQSRDRQTFIAVVRQWAQASCFQYLRSRGSTVQRGGSGTTTTAASTCNMTWDAPRLIDNKGLRQIGQNSNVNVRLSGFSRGARVRLQNNGPTTVRGPLLTLDGGGNYSYYDSTQIKDAEYNPGFYNTYVLDQNNKTLTTCDFGFKIESTADSGQGGQTGQTGTDPVCKMTWSAPRLIDGKGLRKIGENSNVNVSLNGFSGGARVQLQNNGPTTVKGSLMTLDSRGAYSYFDSTQITDAEYNPGFYNTYVLDQNNKTLTICDFGFKIEPAAN